MSDEFSTVPRDLAGRIEKLEDVFDGEYESLVGDVRSLPSRKQLPPCQLCGEALAVSNVFVTESGVAVAVRLTCENAQDHESGQGATFLFELLTRDVYPERRLPDDTEPTVTLTLTEFRRALDRAADGDPVEDIVTDCRDGH